MAPIQVDSGAQKLVGEESFVKALTVHMNSMKMFPLLLHLQLPLPGLSERRLELTKLRGSDQRRALESAHLSTGNVTTSVCRSLARFPLPPFSCSLLTGTFPLKSQSVSSPQSFCPLASLTQQQLELGFNSLHDSKVLSNKEAIAI